MPMPSMSVPNSGSSMGWAATMAPPIIGAMAASKIATCLDARAAGFAAPHILRDVHAEQRGLLRVDAASPLV